MRGTTRAATIIVAVVALIAAMVRPAAADPTYAWLLCGSLPPTTGSLSDVTAVEYDGDTGSWRVTATGILAPCLPPAPVEVYAIASYSNGWAHGWAARYPTGGGSFEAVAAVDPQTDAVCLIDGANHRLDCMRIAWVPGDGGLPQPVTAGHIPVDSPEVSLEARVYLGRASGIGPSCGMCV
jgi:hypothetical protein